MADRNDTDLQRYAKISAVIRKISELVHAVRGHLPWYIQMTRDLTVQTETKTGVSGDQIAEMAVKLSECLPIIEKMVERARELDKKIKTARLN